MDNIVWTIYMGSFSQLKRTLRFSAYYVKNDGKSLNSLAFMFEMNEWKQNFIVSLKIGQNYLRKQLGRRSVSSKQSDLGLNCSAVMLTRDCEN